MLAHLMMERELAFAVTTRSAKWTPSNMLAINMMNNFCPQLMTEMKNEMAKVLAVAMKHQRRVPAIEEVALEAMTREELAQEGAQDVHVGTGIEAIFHYVPTAERMGSTSLTTASSYQ